MWRCPSPILMGWSPILTPAASPFTDWPGNPGAIGVHRNGFRQIYVQDPDGYWIEINDHRPPAV